MAPFEAIAGGLLIGSAAALLLLLTGRIAGVSGMAASATRIGSSGMPRAQAASFLVGLPLGTALVAAFVRQPDMTVTSSVPMLIVAGLLGGIRTREAQRRWVLRAAIGGMAAGVFVWALLLLPMARMLPESWHFPEKLAASVVGTDRWTAGQRMMTSYAPGAWSRIARAAELDTTNREALDECGRDAARTGRPQRCTVRVSPSMAAPPIPAKSRLDQNNRPVSGL